MKVKTSGLSAGGVGRTKMPWQARIVMLLIFGLIIFIGMPLAGWGVDDVRGFFGGPIRMAYVIITIVLQVSLVIIMPSGGAGRARGTKIVLRQHWALVLLQFFSLVMMMAGGISDRTGLLAMSDAGVIRYSGLVLYAIGVVLMHWTAHHLGRLFSVEVTIQEGHRLVTDGPYKYLRHPRYASIVIFATGFSLLFRSWLAMICNLCMLIVLVWRIGDEERLLSEEFGSEWQAYAGRTWRMVPFVY